jgi:uncharacterized protein (TIGR03067 family)
MGLHFLAALALSFLTAADVPSDKSDKALTKDLDKMQGRWSAAGGEQAGEAIPKEDVKTIRFVITNDSYTFTMSGHHEKGTLKLDASKKPKTVDIHITEGGDAGQTQLGIYELEGDTLKICFAQAGQERPTEFATKPESRTGLLIFQRAKDDK